MRRAAPKRSILAALLAVALAPAGAAAAPCVVPVPPDTALRPARPALPAKPACLDAKDGCPGFEAYSYNDAIKAYNAQLPAFRGMAETYQKQLKAYVDGSVAYATCELKALQ